MTLMEVLALVAPVLPGGLVLLLAEGNTRSGSLLNSQLLAAAIPSPTARFWILVLVAWAVGRAIGQFQFGLSRLISNLWVPRLDTAVANSGLWNNEPWRRAATAYLGSVTPAYWDEEAWKQWFLHFRGVSYFMRPPQVVTHRATVYCICECAIVTLTATAFCQYCRHWWVYLLCAPLAIQYVYLLYLDYYRSYKPSVSSQAQIEFFIRVTRTNEGAAKPAN